MNILMQDPQTGPAVQPGHSSERSLWGVTWTSTAAGAGRQSVKVRVFRPRHATAAGCLVWAHGGSWTTGSVDGWHMPCLELAGLSGWTVVSVEYRLAPAHTYADGLTDVLTALSWSAGLLTAAAQGTPLAVGGDSAGGTLAASAALAWRGREYPLAAQILAYPPLDQSCGSASFEDAGRFPRRDDMRLAWRRYLGPVAGAVAEDGGRYLPPMETADLRGAPPAFVAVGTLDPVRDEVGRYADRLAAAGTPVAVRRFTDTEHGAFLAQNPHGQAMRAWLALAAQKISGRSRPGAIVRTEPGHTAIGGHGES